MKNATSSLIAPEIRHIYIIYIIKLHIIYYNYILYIIIMYYILNILIFILHYYILYYVSYIIYYTLYLNIYLSRLIPQVAENAAARVLSEAKPLALRRPTPKGWRRAKSRGREGGDSRGKRVCESIPDGWRPEASPPAGRSPEAKASVETGGLPSRREKLCLCLSLTQTLSPIQKDGETETVKT